MSDNITINDLTEEERQLALSILKQMQEEESKGEVVLHSLIDADWKEKPVDILTFVDDNYYLGEAWHDAYGRSKMFPYWRDVLKKIFPDEYTTAINTLMVSGARGLGKAQPLDALVLTEHGYKAMGDMRVGDKVWGRDGELHSVIGVFPQGMKKCYKVEFSDHTSTEACEDHLWEVIDGRKHDHGKFATRVLTTKEIIAEGEKGFNIPIVKPIQYKHQDHYITPYLIGSLLGKLDSYDAFIPEEYLYDDVESRIALLQGLLDFSGQVTESHIDFVTLSSQLSEDVKFLVQSLGGITIYEHQVNQESDTYYVGIVLPTSIEPFRLSRKLDIWKARKPFEPSRRIVSITPIEDKECQCILVDSEEHLYLTNDCIVTHNTEIGVLCGAYLMYRIMCLSNPLQYYNLKLSEKICFAFLNITKELAEDIANSKFQKTVQMSPWFMERGTLTGRDNIIWVPPDPIEIIIGSQPRHVVGKPIFFFLTDEVNFVANKSVDEQKAKALDLIDTALGGMKTRFTNHGINYGLACVASSKRSEQSFMENYIKTKTESDPEHTLIVDEPTWNVRPASEFSGKRFNVAIGNKFLPSLVLKDGEDTKPYIDKGYIIMPTPIEYKPKFVEDIERALCDFAGISSSSLSTYINGAKLTEAKSNQIQNLFRQDIIEVGNNPEDHSQYYHFIDLDRVPKGMRRMPLFVHFDMSLSGDKTGIGGVWIATNKTGGSSASDLTFQLAFSVSVKAPHGYQVSFEKGRQFIYWLKQQGFNVCGISSDTFQSADFKQQMIAKGYNYDTISVDRVESEPGDATRKICKPYSFLRNCIYERKILIYEDCPLLTQELVQLERNNNSGKVDHPTSGCFTGDTKISLVGGRELTFLEVIDEFNQGKINYIYSFNEQTKIIEPKPIINAFKTKENAKLVRVTLDNGEEIRCTPDHRFMLRDGSYCHAEYLLPNDSLMPLYRKISGKGLKGYRLYYEPMQDCWHYEHRQFAKEILDEHYLVHHKNCNKLDNSPTNLIWCSRGMHQKIHAEVQTGAQSEEAKAKRSLSVKKWHDTYRGTDVYENRSKKISNSVIKHNGELEHEARMHAKEERYKRYLESLDNGRQKRLDAEKRIKDIEAYYGVNWDDLSGSEKNSYGIKYSRLINPDIQSRISSAISENHKLGKYENSKKALERCNEISHLKKLIRDSKKIAECIEICIFYGIEDWDALSPNIKCSYKHRYHNMQNKNIKNHKVVKVEYIEDTEDVYDITVADNHNFALSSGVFVHNSKDQSDGVCGALWNASQHAEEFAYMFGSGVDSMLEANVTNEVGKNINQITLDFEQELMKTHLIDNNQLNAIKQNNNNSNAAMMMAAAQGFII